MNELFTFGVDATTGELIVPTLAEADVAASVLKGDRDSGWSDETPRPGSFGLVDSPDPYDPQAMGWVVVVGRDDPTKRQLIEALTPLAQHRSGGDGWGPLEYPAGTAPYEWIRDVLCACDPIPKYVVLAGTPTQLPFALQAALASAWAVGRLDFAAVHYGVEAQDLTRLRGYVDRLLGAERPDRFPTTHAVVFAPGGARPDPTFYSRHLMAGPLAEFIAGKGTYSVASLFDGEATVDRLLAEVAVSRPALLFTAGHGVATRRREGFGNQAAFNGALVDQLGARLTAGDLPPDDQPFVEGGVVFQFACFGYGTPATSGYTHWSERIPPYEATTEFVSALPKAALAHPRGPLAYIAHADYALLHADADVPGRARTGPLSGRIAPFRGLVSQVLNRVPVGDVLAPIGAQLGLLNHQLAGLWNSARQAASEHAAPPADRTVVDTFLRRNDARYYFLLGDPAARPLTT
jgi:hypothetical protein